MELCVVTGRLYLGVFICYQEYEKELLAEKVTGWTYSVEVLSGVDHQHPQTAYADLQKYLQQ